MRISLNLLKKFVDFKTDDIKIIERTFTDKSAEIDEVEFQNAGLEKVVIGKIEKIEKHPNADKMQVTQTNVGNEVLQIVCGAKNIFEGQYVPVALNGAILPGDFEIKKADKRGIESNGMICAETEMGIAEESEGIMDLGKAFPDVDFSNRIGENFAQFYGLDDVVFVVENTAITNRPDLFSHMGWVREALTIGIASENKEESEKEKGVENRHACSLQDDFPLNFTVDPEVCSRMQAIKISNVKNGESPDWMQKILLACGIRPISLLVDLTNYVMVLQGVPVHAFDLSKINGSSIQMRKAKKGEKIITLDGIERKVPESTILMEDEKQIFDLCGIMGGENSGVDENTSEVWVHVPVYDPILIRRAAIALDHRTDASTIYEKRVPDSQVPFAMQNMIDLILELSPGAEVSSKVFEHYPVEAKVRSLKLSKEKLNYYIGEELEGENVMKILRDLGFECSDIGEYYEVIVPKFRLRDIEIEEDLIEEIMRIYGLDKIKLLKPSFEMKISRSTNAFDLEEKAKEIMISQGAYEVLNFSFLGKKLLDKTGVETQHAASLLDPGSSSGGQGIELIKITNPLSSELEFMRPMLLPYLLENTEKNLLNAESFTLFEVARVFSRDWNTKGENKNLAFISYNCEFFDAKKIAENLFEKLGLTVQFKQSKDIPSFAHGGQCSDIILQGKFIGNLASLHPKIAKNFDIEKNTVFMEVDFQAIEKAKIRIKKYKAFSRFPSITRDQSFIIDEKMEMTQILKKLGSVDKLQTGVELVDVYQGKGIEEGRKSITLSFHYGAMDRTLTDEEVIAAHKKVLEKAEKEGLGLR